MIKQLFAISILLTGVLSNPINPKDAQSCQVCHPVDPNKINVHLIPHSHDDVGWLKTVDQYYYGSLQPIARAGVQYIITSAIEALKLDPNRRYVQVETAFFWKWWQRQSDEMKQSVIDLVNNGQLEITNAAWSMNDEADVNYQSTIDQFTHGLRTINETLGKCGAPTIGWQIDPFGHSREQASIFAQLGFDAEFFSRIDYNDLNTRRANKDMEVVWKGSANLDNTNIFTVVFPDNGYAPPSGFCYDILCDGQVINDDPTSPDYNVPSIVNSFQERMEQFITYYRTNNVLIPMGEDFQYQSAEKNFNNMDKLMAGFEGNDRINIMYSTPSCYIKAVNEAAAAQNIEFTVKTDDFFPYASGPHNYWTGYFTSRPNLKRNERLGNNILQVAKQLASFSKVNGEDLDQDLTSLKEAMGILQHHDAITGTSKEAVADDYTRLWAKGIKNAEPTLGAVITNLLKKDATADINLNLQTCLLANVSICETTKASRFVVSVYNPLERPVSHYVRLPVPDGTYAITGPAGDVTSDLLDSVSTFSYINDVAGTPSPKELVFMANNIPAFGINLYYIEKTASKSLKKQQGPKPRLGTDTTGFEIDEGTGLLKSVTMNGQTLQIEQQFFYYEGFNGNNAGEDNIASGAYIFRPLTNQSSLISDTIAVTTSSGSLVDEVRQQINDWVTQIIRVYKDEESNYIEFDWLVGPIEIDYLTGIGREIVSRFTIQDFDNSETFYTDSNGRELLRRQLNARSDYEYDSSLEPIASNYYPITSKIVIKDETQNLEVAILNDRAQGGSSLENGAIELMVHRRLLRDDAKGVAEPLNDDEYNQGVVARGQHYLVIGSSDSNVEGGKSIVAQERELALRKLLSPLVLVGDASSADLSLENVQNSLNFNFNGLRTTLPDNVHILTLEPWQEDTYVLRLEHIFENNEDDTLSQSVTVDLTGLFTLFDITEIRETTLAVNHWLDEFEAKDKFVWNTKGGGKATNVRSTSSINAANLEVTLDPMQIRTFVIKVSKSA